MTSNDLIDDAIRLIEDKEYEKAIDLLKNASDSHEAFYYSGIAYLNLKMYDEAFDVFNEATNIFPEYISAWMQKGIVLQKLGLDNDALQAFDEAISILRQEGSNKKYISTLKKKGKLFKSLGFGDDKTLELEDEVKSLEREGREKSKIEEEILFCRGVTLRRLGKRTDANKTMKVANSIHQNKLKNLNLQGLKYFQRGNVHGAKLKFIEAVEFDKNFAEAWNNLGVTFYFEENYSGAQKNFNRAIKINSDADWAWNNIGFVLQRSGAHKAALKAYNRALEINSFNERAWFHKIILLALIGKQKDSLDAFNKSHGFLFSSNEQKINADSDISQKMTLMI